MMRELSSGVSTSPQRLVRKVNEVVKTAQRQQVAQAAPEVAMTGVPSEPDYRKGVTEAFQNIIPIHRAVGNSIVGGIAYRTNELAWRDYNPGFFDGLFAPSGEYSSKPFYYTDLAAATANPSLIKTAGEDELPVYGETSTPNRSLARPFTTKVIQDTDVW
jgi:hypothetical protein